MSDDDGPRRPGRPAPRYGEYASSSSAGSSSDGSGLSEADARIVAEAAEYRRAQAERDAPAAPAGRGAKKGAAPAAPQTLAEQMAEERKAARERMLAERRDAEKAAEAERRQARRSPSAGPTSGPGPSSEPGRPGYLPTQEPRRAGRRLDAAVTIALLAVGALNLLFSLGSYTDLPGALSRAFPALGIAGAYTPTSATGPVGVALLVITVSVFAATVALSLRRIRLGRIAFWVPLVGVVVATVVSALLLSSLLTADPAFQQFVMNRG
ncbi:MULTISPECIES: DUF6264 family protein [Clavibacter]|uniref:Uncharacterized protein n=1 Tax=Clavibacter tessellarius TaxID=31965 RepID=A0A154UYB0_9MICO|nr:DUF6264 family protein [Clavibacter michiganensis]KZC94066.1 hypothetical protein AWH51_15320 [Clavibacter michiganensis subsp. tessellarius]